MDGIGDKTTFNMHICADKKPCANGYFHRCAYSGLLVKIFFKLVQNNFSGIKSIN